MDADVLGVADAVMSTFEQLGVKCRIVGSVASSKLGMLRATFDVDILAELERKHVAALKTRLAATFYLEGRRSGGSGITRLRGACNRRAASAGLSPTRWGV